MKKYVFLWIVFYVIVHSSSGDFSVKDEGMDQTTVSALITQNYGVPFDFVDKNTYNLFVSSHSAIGF